VHDVDIMAGIFAFVSGACLDLKILMRVISERWSGRLIEITL